ncbi:MAG: hypothetical protein PHR55_00120 [Bacilli bacterium]|nr:hypothetical protein [Bacilli bacterium]
MNRFIKIIMFIFLFILLTNKVNASQVDCYYGSNSFKIYVGYSSGSTPTVYEVTTNQSLQYTSLGNSYVKAQDLMNADGTLFCPDKLFSEMTVAGRDVKYHVSFTEKSLNNPGFSFSLISSESTVVNDPIDPNNEESKDVICSYGKNSLIFNKSTGAVNISLYGVSSNIPIFGPTIESLEKYNYQCPPQLCFYCNTRESQMCSVGFEKAGLLECVGSGTWEEQNNNNNNSNEPNNPIDTGGEVTCDAFKEITGPIWFWMRILAPIIALVFGTLDLLKAVAAEDQKAVKKATSDFMKRIGLTALLFLLPFIINMIVGLTQYGSLSACL